MGRIRAVENISLDGVMQAPGRPDEDTRGGFTRGGWAVEAMSADPAAVQAAMGSGDRAVAMLFGRWTYEDLVGHWLSTDEPNPFTQVLRSTPKYVATRTLSDPLPHPNSTALRGDDVIEQVSALRDRIEGDIIILGSGNLVRQLVAAGLIDSFVLTTVPVVLGSGTRLFGETHAEVDATTLHAGATGIVVQRLDVRPDRA